MKLINKLKCCSLLMLLLSHSFVIKSQVIAVFELGIADQSFDPDFVSHMTIGTGYLFSNNISLYGGFKIQRRNLLGRTLYDNRDYGSDDFKLNLLLYAATRYSLKLYKIKKGRDKYDLGIFPELKLYYSLFTEKSLKYKHEYQKTQKGMNPSVLYSLGLGVFYGPFERGYVALKYEYCTSLLFVYDKQPYRNIPKSGFFTDGQHIISISFFFNTDA